MKIFFAVSLALLLGACASPGRIPLDYRGADAGSVVISIGQTRKTSYPLYSLVFRKQHRSADPQQGEEGSFMYAPFGIFEKSEADYQSDQEKGSIFVKSLPPGEYEIYKLDISWTTGMAQGSFSSTKDFSIPFEVKPNATTYLGNYQANRTDGKNLFGMTVPGGAVFVVANRKESDIALVKDKITHAHGEIIDATPSPKSVGSPYFVDQGIGGQFEGR